MDDVVNTMSNSTRSNSCTLIDGTPATGLSAYVAAEHSAHTAPDSRDKGTAVSFASLVQVAVGARVPSLLDVPPRGAPV